MLIREFSLIIDNESYKCSAAVLKAFVNSGDKMTVVLVFTQAISFNVRKSIREFLRSLLQGKITKMALDTVPDPKDYTLSNNRKYILDETEEAEEVIEEELPPQKAAQPEPPAEKAVEAKEAPAAKTDAAKPAEASAEPVDISQPDQV